MVRNGNHQGIAASAGATSYVELEDFLKDLPADKPLIVVGLDEIEDPQNFGAILRNAGFFGVDAVIVPARNVAELVGGAPPAV
jgi:23S rRNA (guanosine2251-2'-O)-methyltransferase